MNPNPPTLCGRSPTVDALFESYKSSGASFLQQDALYALPSKVFSAIDSFSSFTWDRLIAEKAFAAQCERLSCIGFRHGHAIRYSLLTTHSPTIDSSEAATHGLSPADIRGLEVLSSKTDTTRERLLGVAGRLIALPSFRSETLKLRTEFESLPEYVRPEWPLRRPLRRQGNESGNPGGNVPPAADRLAALVHPG